MYIKLVNIIYAVADACSEAPHVDHAHTTEMSMVEGGYTVYQCDEFYSFDSEEGEDDYSIECRNFQWLGLPVPDCISKIFTFYFITHL